MISLKDNENIKEKHQSKQSIKEKLIHDYANEDIIKEIIDISLISEKNEKEEEGNSFLETGDNTHLNDSMSSAGFVIVSLSGNQKNKLSISEKKEKSLAETSIDFDELSRELIEIQKKNKKCKEKYRAVFLTIEILLGCALIFASIFLFCLGFDFSSSGQRILSSGIEIVLVIISSFSIFPKKNGTMRKILGTLYIWMGLFLIPLSFFSESGIKDENMKNRYHQMLLIRLYLYISQVVIFFIALIAKIEI